MQEKLQELRNGFETAYIDKTSTSNLAYKPQFEKLRKSEFEEHHRYD